MKHLNKQILEAVRRGIGIALDDYEDTNISILVSAKLIDKNQTKEYLDLMEVVVDLGLPSGTLWCKYNLGAICLPNDIKSWYGNFYSWGEVSDIKPDGYNWDTYKFYDGPNLHHDNEDESVLYHISKYNVNDELEVLLLEDDAAYLDMHLHNFKFHIPTVGLAKELIENTKTIWVPNVSNKPEYKDANGYTGSGWFVISKINGNYIFFPDTGCIEHKKRHIMHDTAVWTNQISSGPASSQVKCADAITFYDHIPNYMTTHHRIYGMFKYYGFPIRPVVNKNGK